MTLDDLNIALTKFRRENDKRATKLIIGRAELKDMESWVYYPNFSNTPEGREASEKYIQELKKTKEPGLEFNANLWGLELVKVDKDSYFSVE